MSTDTQAWRAATAPSRTVEWGTPPDIFAALNAEFGFTLDAAASPTNAKCPRYFTVTTDGLWHSWAGETVWLNPPYGRDIASWIRKARESARHEGATVVCLVPARTDTAWWHDDVIPAAEVRFLRGRVAFVDAEGRQQDPAPFPCAVLVFRPSATAQEAA